MSTRCLPQPRGARAVDGAVLGAAVGVIGGLVVGGIIYAMDRSAGRAARWIGLGIFGVAVVAQSVISAQPPEC